MRLKIASGPSEMLFSALESPASSSMNAVNNSFGMHNETLALAVRVSTERRWSLPSLSCGPVSLFDCVSFAHVLALLSRAIKARALLVINVRLGIDPHQSTSAA